MDWRALHSTLSLQRVAGRVKLHLGVASRGLRAKGIFERWRARTKANAGDERGHWVSGSDPIFRVLALEKFPLSGFIGSAAPDKLFHLNHKASVFSPGMRVLLSLPELSRLLHFCPRRPRTAEQDTTLAGRSLCTSSALRARRGC